MKLLCKIGLHRYQETHRSWRTLALAHLSPLAGSRHVCERCGKVFDDLPYGRMVDSDGRTVNSAEELETTSPGNPDAKT